MATSLATLEKRTRRYLRDYPFEDVLTASATNSASTITVADSTLYGNRFFVQIESEVLYAVSPATATTVAVRRGQKGSTAASHANSSTVLVRPDFYQEEIVDALNAGIEASFPLLYTHVVDETLTGSAGVYEYEVPDMPGHTGHVIPILYEIQLKDSTEDAFRKVRAWEVVRGPTPKVKFRRSLDGDETIRLMGYGPLPALASGGSLNDQFPPAAVTALVEYAASYLMGSGEAGRVRVDTGATDNREQANAAGVSMRASQALAQRFYTRLLQAAMPPLPRHIKSVL